jgi:hypothetical protein
MLRERGQRDDLRFLPALAYVAQMSGDASLRALVLERAQRIELGSWGKPFTLNGRIGFRIHSLLSSAGGGGTQVGKAAPTPQKEKK